MALRIISKKHENYCRRRINPVRIRPASPATKASFSDFVRQFAQISLEKKPCLVESLTRLDETQAK